MRIRTTAVHAICLVLVVALVAGAWSRPSVDSLLSIAPPPPPSPKPFDLKMSIETYQTKLDQFQRDFRDSKNWTDDMGNPESNYNLEIPVTVVGGFNCTLGQPIIVTPSKNIKGLTHRRKNYPSDPSDLDSKPSAPKYGYLIARIENKSTTCNTVPLTVGPGVYYWVVRQNPQPPYQMQSLFVSDAKAEVVQKVNLVRCDTQEDSHAHDAIAVFSKGEVCDPKRTHFVARSPGSISAHMQTLAGGVPAARARAGFSIFGSDFNLWFTCDQGCCYADGF